MAASVPRIICPTPDPPFLQHYVLFSVPCHPSPQNIKDPVNYTDVTSLSLSACWSCLLPVFPSFTTSSKGFSISSNSFCWAIIKSSSWSSLQKKGEKTHTTLDSTFNHFTLRVFDSCAKIKALLTLTFAISPSTWILFDNSEHKMVWD